MKIPWHKWQRIANRITGFNVPWFGVTWNPPPLERTAAERAITYLESKGLFYAAFRWENPNECYADASEIRDELTRQMLELAKDSHVYRQLDAMRDACRMFRNLLREGNLEKIGYYQELDDKQRADFLLALGALRYGCGQQIMTLAVEYGVDVADHLKASLPSTEEESE
ncbi:DUF6650 family protein [Paraburkholderia youngii]|uniref:DUF6650 family protein n=1 Tax=Paraburkholderia youngii TaxID=2782701 RepID=UPI0034A177FB